MQSFVNGTLNSLCALLVVTLPNSVGRVRSTHYWLRLWLNFQQWQRTAADLIQQRLRISSIIDPPKLVNISSMHQDLIQHRLTEIDYLNGYAARKGQERGIPTPVNQLITQLVHTKEALVIEK